MVVYHSPDTSGTVTLKYLYIRSTYITLGIETKIMPSGKQNWQASSANPGVAGQAGHAAAAAAGAVPVPDPKIINRTISLSIKKVNFKQS